MPVQQGRFRRAMARLTADDHELARQELQDEAELYDGTGTITLIWLGRRRIGGIECGRSLVARGRLTSHDGRPTIYNASYELKPSVA